MVTFAFSVACLSRAVEGTAEGQPRLGSAQFFCRGQEDRT